MDYEYRVMSFGREVAPAQVSQALSEHAEYGRWELARSAVYWGGRRRVWLRRRIIRVRRTA